MSELTAHTTAFYYDSTYIARLPMNTDSVQPPATSGNQDIEYQSAIAYIHHMYDTRHQILQFVVGINTALLAVVFEFLKSDVTKAVLSLIGGMITLALALMAKRSLLYLKTMEGYVTELESELQFGLISTTSARMPRGRDSNDYLLFVYWALAATWLFLCIYYGLSLME